MLKTGCFAYFRHIKPYLPYCTKQDKVAFDTLPPICLREAFTFARLCLFFNNFLFTYPTEDILNLFERPQVVGFTSFLLLTSLCLHFCNVPEDISSFLDTIGSNLVLESKFKAFYFEYTAYLCMATVCFI